MAREKPLDMAVVQAWLGAWNESDVFSDAAVLHLQSFITDPHCLVVVTVGAGREPRSLVFRRIKQMMPVPTEIRRAEDMFVGQSVLGGPRGGPLPPMFV